MGEWWRSSTHSYSQHYMDVSGQLQATAALFPAQNTPHPLGLLPEIEAQPLGCPVRVLDTTVTKLSRL
jgi:hypothetical protein